MTACAATDRAVTGDGYQLSCGCGNWLPLPDRRSPVFRRSVAAVIEYCRDVADDHDRAVDMEIVAPPFDRVGVWMGTRIQPDGAVDARLSPWPLSSDPRCPTVDRASVVARLRRGGWVYPPRFDADQLRADGTAVTQRFTPDVAAGRVAYHLVVAADALFPTVAVLRWELRGYLCDTAGIPQRCLDWHGDPNPNRHP